MKCLKKTSPAGTQYKRVHDGDAAIAVVRDGWEYCSKAEYKKAIEGSKDHG